LSTYDFLIIGAGAVGSNLGLTLIQQSPGSSVAILDNADSRSATVAAGAMHAVFGEVEHPHSSTAPQETLLALGLRARELFNRQLSSPAIRESIVTADDTCVYLRSDATKFERLNYEAMRSVALDHGTAEIAAEDEARERFGIKIPIKELTLLRGEFGFSAPSYLKYLRHQLGELGVTFLKGRAHALEDLNAGLQVLIDDDHEVSARKVIVCAGASSTSSILESYGVVPIIRGVGSAIRLKEANRYQSGLKRRVVYRTVNRGGAQCGLHLVPGIGGNEGWYVGAGNYLSDDPDAGFRPDTVRYLTALSADEIFGKEYVYESTGSFLLGDRARTVDGFPVVGAVDGSSKLFVLSGFNRVGLTLSPALSELVVPLLLDADSSLIPEGWAPCRNWAQFGTLDEATEYYTQSRLANLIEHSIIDRTDYAEHARFSQKCELIVREMNREITKALALTEDFVIDPDLYGHFQSKLSLSRV